MFLASCTSPDVVNGRRAALMRSTCSRNAVSGTLAITRQSRDCWGVTPMPPSVRETT
jgi:hypothetical protein